jgi:ethanolaminephosphotransferase
MFLPWTYDLVHWGCSLALLGAFVFGPELYITPIFGLSPTAWVEITLYTSGVLTSHPVIAWNIYK